MPAHNIFVITDANIFHHYENDLPPFPVFVMDAGESCKTMDTVMQICRWLLAEGAGRNAFLLGAGGGVVCDMTGLAASIFMRGVQFGYIATSLLAQIDAAIGGKNGVNLDGYKNILGTFNQPKFVLCDIRMLRTLPSAELKNGMAEAIKHCLIGDREMFSYLSDKSSLVFSLDTDVLYRIIVRSVKIKADIVNKDEREKGERRKLNLGHTWGHAIEKVSGMPHGQAVAIGLAFSAAFSVHKGLLTDKEYTEITSLLKAYDLPVKSHISPKTILHALAKDKKKQNEEIFFVLMDGIGKVKTERLRFEELESFALLNR